MPDYLHQLMQNDYFMWFYFSLVLIHVGRKAIIDHNWKILYNAVEGVIYGWAYSLFALIRWILQGLAFVINKLTNKDNV